RFVQEKIARWKTSGEVRGSLQDMRARFPAARIYLIHLPERGEVIMGRYKMNPRRLLRGLDIKYFSALEKCHWSESMFYKYDTHPNAYGYQNISDCVEKYLSEQA